MKEEIWPQQIKVKSQIYCFYVQLLLVEKMLSNQEDYSIDKAGIFPKVYSRKTRENSPKLQKRNKG